MALNPLDKTVIVLIQGGKGKRSARGGKVKSLSPRREEKGGGNFHSRTGGRRGKRETMRNPGGGGKGRIDPPQRYRKKVKKGLYSPS